VLPGVARARLADLVGGLREAGLPGVELAAHRGFAANAARGIVPLAEVDGIQVVPNGRTEQLMEEFWP
jgi:branched-subunit amino acid aminotransferase/4-amino-4-deoxychorismate lyase